MFRTTSFFLSVLSLNLFAIEKIAPKEAFQAVQSGSAILVDVRELSELVPSGKAALAQHLPKSSIDSKNAGYKNFLSSTSKDKLVIFYCRSGKRAEAAAEVFSKIGYSTKNMGGFQDWVDAGLPVQQ